MEEQEYRLHIRNMVCPRCISAVRRVLAGCGVEVRSVELGLAVLEGRPDEGTMARVGEALREEGFEIIGDRKEQLVEQMKGLIVKAVHYDAAKGEKTNLSQWLSKECAHDYSYLSKLFSESCGVTLERYYILQKIEKVKELLEYDELTLGEIADRTGYSSTAHLSSQFRSVTGMTPTAYRSLGRGGRKPLCEIL